MKLPDRDVPYGTFVKTLLLEIEQLQKEATSWKRRIDEISFCNKKLMEYVCEAANGEYQGGRGNEYIYAAQGLLFELEGKET